MQPGSQALQRSGFNRKRQDATVALFQLVRQSRDLIQEAGKPLIVLWQHIEFGFQFRFH